MDSIFPKIIAAKAIYPRPADILFEKAGSNTAMSKLHQSPANTPDISTTIYLVL